jgi:hemerythrin-like domain-containing protein
MKATKQLMDEHEGIRVMLLILGAYCGLLESECRIDPGHVEGSLDFIRGFADRCHHAKEEEVLFPALEAAGIAREGGPIAVMLKEHNLGRGYIRATGEAFERCRGGDPKAAADMAASLRSYINLLDQHIDKENNVLFVMADRVLSETKQEDLFEAFERIETEKIGIGKHEAYHRLLDELTGIYLKPGQAEASSGR